MSKLTMPLIVLLLSFLLVSPSKAANGAICGTLRSNSQNSVQWQEEMNCRDLKVGEKRLVDAGIASPTGIPANYLVHRTGSSSYQIEIPINVHSSSWRKHLRISDNETESRMKERIQLCAELSDSLLKGPNGEKLKFKPVFVAQMKSLWYYGGTNDVKVSQIQRSNSTEYNEDLGCSPILHELAHLTGLVDEYEETTNLNENSTTGAFANCRVLGPDSLMADHRKALENFQTGRYETSYTISGQICQGRGTQRKCSIGKMMFSGDDKQEVSQVEAETRFKFAMSLTLASGSMLGLKPGSASEIEISNMGPINKFKKIQTDSMLEPAHFRAIIYPGCQSKNSLYYKCARFAYWTNLKERKILGIPLPNSDCAIPPECQKGDWLK